MSILNSKNYLFDTEQIERILQTFGWSSLYIELVNDDPDYMDVVIEHIVSIFRVDNEDWIVGIVTADDLELIDNHPPQRDFLIAFIAGLKVYADVMVEVALNQLGDNEYADYVSESQQYLDARSE